MAVAVLPMLLESFAAGSVMVVAGMAAWYLFKHDIIKKKTTQPKTEPPPVETSPISALKKPAPEPAIVSEPPPAVVEEISEQLKEEPMLKRHYLHNVRQMLMAVTFPRPTDSVLSRHYDEMIDAKAEECLEDEAKMAKLEVEYEALQNTVALGETSKEAVAEEPMLRRHYLHNVRQMLMAVTFPRPTDSVLSRHYDEMIDAKAEECLEDEAKMARLEAEYEALQLNTVALGETSEEGVAEEPMLRRHYLNNIRQMLIAVTFPHPTDSVLSRHYDEMIDAKAEECLEDEAKMARLEAEYEVLQTGNQQEIPPTTFSSGGKPQANKNPAGFKQSSIPEDSMLKRHYLSMIRTQIEAMKGACPTDCTLRRHYTTMINMEMDNYLATH